MKKKLLSILLSAALVCSLGTGNSQLTGSVKAAEVTAESIRQPFVEMNGEELIRDMGAGWNLGNTMDGHTGFTPGETVWQNVTTTKKLIKEVHDLGFNTVRIPVTWGTMIDDENNYAIDEAWLGRVQDIVDYCISQDMYAIVNIHHDGAEQMGWLRIATDDQEALEKKFAGVWKNIATAFKDYDEHLILESMNEVKGSEMSVYEENQVIMKLNQIFVDTVRATGSNNAKRWLLVPGKYNYIDSICNKKNGFKLPTDSVENRIALSVHNYTPGSFTHTENTTELAATYSTERLQANDEEMKPLYDMYTSKGIPVIVGEYGAKNKDNVSERAYYFEGMNRIFQKYKLVGVYWDQGWYDRSSKPDYSFSIIDRETGKPIEKEVTDALLRGYFGNDSDYATLTKSPAIKEITDITLSETTVDLKVNEEITVTAKAAPADTNDLVFWKTEDETIATVAYGRIQAKGIGTTKITVFSQSGSATSEMIVNVTAEQAAVPCTKLQVGTQEYSLAEGKSTFLSVAMTPVETTESLYFTSSDESVVTVSTIGKLVATGVGDAVVKVCTSGGKEVSVKVKVTAAEVAKEVSLAINVYYNDGIHNYYANEISGDSIAVNTNGQYTLTFDCERDLSDAAKAAGVSTLNRVTAIYIKDNDVANGTASKTPLSACQIRYDKIVVDGVELTLINKGYKSALKESGIFDTNDPINSWDGSAVEEVSVASYAASFSTIENPKKITITFTLNEMCFEGSEPEPTLPPEMTDSKEPVEIPKEDESPVPEQSIKVGEKITTANGVYKVTNIGMNAGTVQYVKPAKKTVTNVVIPATVKVNGKSYKVTSIADKALKNNTSVKKLTIGKNVTSIGKEAFCGCKSLKTLTIKTAKLTLKKVGANAFKGVGKKGKLTLPKKKAVLYRKIISKRS